MKPIFNIAAVAAIAVFSLPAHAKQCVFNKGGFVLHVHWYKPDALSVYSGEHPSDWATVRPLREPVQAATLTAGFGNCTTTDEPLLAFVSVPGLLGYVARPGVTPKWPGRSLPLVANGTRMYRASHPAWRERKNPGVAAVTCKPIDTLGDYCPGDHAVGEGLPPGQALLVIQPSSIRYLDFFGTAFDVQWAEGGPIQ